MEQKINIAELLKNCPKGMELDCTIYDNVKLIGVDEICITPFPIRVSRGDGYTMTLTKYGQYADADYAKCVIFPKGKTTWEGFQRHFKDGDVLSNGICICIYNGNENENHYGLYVGVGNIDYPNYFIVSTQNSYFTKKNAHLATEEEKEKLFDAIKANGYKWNPETKTLEKLVVPKFKVGNKIRHRLTGTIYKVLSVLSNGCGGGVYDVAITNEIGKSIDIKEQDSYELVPNKFDITTLKPFESKVLVRSSMDGLWKPAVFGFRNGYNDNAFYIVGGSCWKQCIPYLNNEHLCGTTNDCDEYYKTWE